MLQWESNWSKKIDMINRDLEDVRFHIGKKDLTDEKITTANKFLRDGIHREFKKL